VRLIVGDRVFVRQSVGKVYEAPALPAESDRTRLLVPVRRSAADLLAEWRALGVRDDVSHVVRVRDRPITVIGARPGDRNVPAVWLDAQYGVIRFVTFVPRETLPTGPTTLDLAFSEHRPLPGGFFFPYRQELFVGGKLLMLFTVRSVAVNTNLQPDHAYGLPALVQSLILLGRRTPLVVRCRPEHVEPLMSLLKLFGVWERPGMFSLWVQAIGPGEGAHAFELGPLVVRTSPVEHGSMPNFAVRADAGARGVVYSS